jgi:hypothetical protein
VRKKIKNNKKKRIKKESMIGIEKRLLQEAGILETSQGNQEESLVFNKLGLLKYIKPLIQNFEHEYKNIYQDTLDEIIKENTTTQSEIIKLEDLQPEESIENEEHHKLPSLERMFLNLEEECLLLNGKNNAQKNRISTLFCQNVFECCQNEDKMNIEEEQADPNTRIINFDKAEYLQLLVPKNGVRRVNGNLDIIENFEHHMHKNEEKENSILDLWCKVFRKKEVDTTRE